MFRQELKVGLVLAAVLAIGLGCADSAYAATPSSSIYVIDMDRAINESISGKAARSNIEDEVRKSEGKLAVRRQEIEKFREDVEKQGALLSTSAMQEKRETLQKRQRDFERSVQDEREALGRKRNMEMKKVVDEVEAVVKDLSDGGQYPVILSKDPNVVVFAADRIDLTDEVVKRLDAKKKI